DRRIPALEIFPVHHCLDPRTCSKLLTSSDHARRSAAVAGTGHALCPLSPQEDRALALRPGQASRFPTANAATLVAVRIEGALKPLGYVVTFLVTGLARRPCGQTTAHPGAAYEVQLRLATRTEPV